MGAEGLGRGGLRRFVTGGNPDPDLADNEATGALTIAPLSDVGVTLTSGSASVVLNGSFAYTLTATNAEGSDATSATAQVALSALLTSTSATGATCTSTATVRAARSGTTAPRASARPAT